MENKVHTISETAKIFGVSRAKVMYWINVGIIEGEKKQGKWRIESDSLMKWKRFQEGGIPTALEEMRRRFEIASAEFKVRDKRSVSE